MTHDNKLDVILQKLDDLAARQDALQMEQRLLYRQIEALFALYHRLELKEPITGLRGWAISPDFAAIIADWVWQVQPKTILELGCGNSTLISAYTLAKIGTGGHVYGVDHQARFADQAREKVAAHGLEDYVTIYHAPLVSYDIDGEQWQWYDLDVLADVPPIDLLVVDGPPQYGVQRDMARYPALPLLLERLAPPATILMDDADRPSEARLARRWLEEFSLDLLRTYDSSYAESDKGAKVFQYD